jgi:hypothetical protein
MLSEFFGFAQIPQDLIRQGIMFKRQVATGLSVGTSLPTSGLTEVTSAAGGVTSNVASITSQVVANTTPSTTPPSTEAPRTTVVPTTASPASSPTDDAATRTQQTSDAAVTHAPSSLTTVTRDGTTMTSAVHTTSADSESESMIVSSLTGTSSNLVVVGGSSTINRSTLSSATTITSPLVGHSTVAQVYTTFYVGNDGKSSSAVVTTSRVLSSTTGFATATILPALQSSGDGSGNGGLSPSSQHVIGGVVGGIGGAILLGGLAIVAWRLWGKKKAQQRESVAQEDYLNAGRSDYSRGNSFGAEKRISPLGSSYSGGISPGSTLNYQNPNGRVNTASNF